MEQGPTVGGQAQAEDWGVGAAGVGWEEHARERDLVEVASAPNVAQKFPTKQDLRATT